MHRFARLLMAVVILLGVGIPARFASLGLAPVHAASDTGLSLQATLLTPKLAEGNQAQLFVHTGALATLTLTVRYAGGSSHGYTGAADGQGRYVFSWAIPLGMQLAGMASLRLDAQRGTLAGHWSSTIDVQAAPLPPLLVQPLQPRFMAGGALDIFVRTAPGAELSYRLTTDDGRILARGGAVADAQGRYVISAPDTFLPRTTIGVTARVSVTQLSGTSVRTARFLLLPRPPLGLYVASTTKAARAGETVGVFVSSEPGTKLTVTVALTSTVVARGAGVADTSGRWVYSTQIFVLLTHPMTAHVTVLATHGLDQRVGHASFLLRPSPLTLPRNRALDKLATANDPTPDLSKYFSQVPDKVIMISTEGQVLRAFEHGVLVHENYVTTGRPELPTVHGIFHVYEKVTPFEFISPWPAGSPYYYPPSWVRYWMPFTGGYGLHDAPWRTVYGPGTNLPHYSTDPGEPVGSHGCVNIPLGDTVWLWNWTPVGTTVVVY